MHASYNIMRHVYGWLLLTPAAILLIVVYLLPEGLVSLPRVTLLWFKRVRKGKKVV